MAEARAKSVGVVDLSTPAAPPTSRPDIPVKPASAKLKHTGNLGIAEEAIFQ
jgi:hypothetical protein